MINLKKSLISDKKWDSSSNEEIYQLGKERLSKHSNKIITLKQDINATRVYYNSLPEILGRILIILSQILVIGSIFSSAIIYAKWSTESMKDKEVSIQIIVRILILLVATVTSLFSLIFVIPLLICKTISTITIWTIAFIFLGFFSFGFSFGFSIYLKNNNISNNYFNSLFVFLGFLFFSSGIGFLLSKMKTLKRELEKAILKSYNL